MLERIGDVVGSMLRSGQEVKLPGIGTLRPATTAARTAFNPATGETVEVPERKTVKFRPDAGLKRSL